MGRERREGEREREREEKTGKKSNEQGIMKREEKSLRISCECPAPSSRNFQTLSLSLFLTPLFLWVNYGANTICIISAELRDQRKKMKTVMIRKRRNAYVVRESKIERERGWNEGCKLGERED